MRLQTKLALLICVLLCGLIVAFSLNFQSLLETTLIQHQGGKALAIAETVAAMPEISQAFSLNQPWTVIQPIAEKVRRQTGAQFIVVGNKDKIRYSHPVVDNIGGLMQGKDNDQALLGKPVVAVETGAMGPSLRGIVPIFDQEHQVIGIVAAGISLEDVENIKNSYRKQILLLALAVIGIGIIGAIFIARSVKKAILGLEPAEITTLYQEKQAVLESVKEGILAINLAGAITMINQQAMQMLNWEDMLGKNIATYSPDSPLLAIIHSGQPIFDQEIFLNDQLFIANYMPIKDDKGHISGGVSSFRSKSELYRLTQELSQVKQYSEALRAQTHEYSNKLYMISGLIQLESYQEAIELISREFDIHQNLVTFIKQEIPDQMIGGLLIGKFNQASELKINLTIDPGSSFKDIPVAINRDDLTTIIGNLTDNAMDAVMNPEIKDRQVKLCFSDYGKDLIIEVEDTGIGVPLENREKIFEQGFSTKQVKNHGIGLFLVQKTIQKMAGHISYSAKPQGGSIFTAIIPKNQTLDKG